MSLKGFHIVFVTVSTLLCIFLALWSLLLAPEFNGATKIVGAIGVTGALVLPVYGIYFYRKITRIHI
ncbi:MAG: hypothetical protein ABIS50_26755 [Luteolibacter sp.]|uniref:hypothetical protein n=1 Tax=Luteolibacter sp. TaxID=1962973 RepID=UPI00326560F7